MKRRAVAWGARHFSILGAESERFSVPGRLDYQPKKWAKAHSPRTYFFLGEGGGSEGGQILMKLLKFQMAASLKKSMCIYVSISIVSIEWSDLTLQFMKKITEIYRKAKKGTTRMLAETFPLIYCIEADIWLPSNMQTFFYRRPQGYALDPLKIRTLTIHTEPPLKVRREHSENTEQSRVNEVSDGRFVRCCVSVAQESESLEHIASLQCRRFLWARNLLAKVPCWNFPNRGGDGAPSHQP